jgi:hypothetical protein
VRESRKATELGLQIALSKTHITRKDVANSLTTFTNAVIPSIDVKETIK